MLHQEGDQITYCFSLMLLAHAPYPTKMLALFRRYHRIMYSLVSAYSLSLRNLEEIMAERDINVDHLLFFAGSFVWCRCRTRLYVVTNTWQAVYGEWMKATS